MQQELMICDKTRTADIEQYAIGSRRGAHVQVGPCVERMLNDDYVDHWLAEHTCERAVHCKGNSEPAGAWL